ncbi:MAG: ATP-binding cassette domain-containing protein [Planctomycetes bacterium]|nr:ATP-binding cassette domain-containing protein [Planctomycetota bacterium]
MPRRNDINNILILGSGPIVIGQGCEFDYSGTQACKALREEGYRVVLVNSNPATIMTDPMFSDRTYIEPITPEAVRKIIAKEKEMGSPIDALLPTLGGQTALNCACALFDEGTLSESGIEMIGATRDVIYKAEDREEFRRIVDSIGLKQANAATVTSLEDAWTFLEQIGLPAIIRPAFTLGGTGSGIAYNRDEFEDLVRRGLDASMIGQVLIDEEEITKASGRALEQLRMKFGMLFQGSALFDSLNVGENVGFSLWEHTSMDEESIATRVRESLQMVGLRGIEEMTPSELSGGMRKRVGLARAIVRNPQIILYDEPTTGVDPIMGDAINNLILELHDKLKVTSVAVTHDMISAYKIASRIAMLYDGKIIEVGKPDEVRNTKNPIVRQFITGAAKGPITEQE